MANGIRFACTALAGVNKVGTLKQDANGYYEVVVGALNVFNSVGQYYVYEQARELFEESSHFMRRVRRGVLRGELGHPKPLPGMNPDAFAQRCMSIYEDNVCCHHKEIFLDMDRVRDEAGNPVIAIVSKLLPSGPHGAQLAKSLENPDENVCFSIRAFTDDFREHGVTKRILRTIVTWDQVNEPGLSAAEKYKSPALEGLLDQPFSRGELERAMRPNPVTGLANESVLLSPAELFTSFGWQLDKGSRPTYLGW